MLGIADSGTYQNLVEQLPMKVRVPETLHYDLHKRGVTDVRQHDLRQTPRFRCCGTGIIAPIESTALKFFHQSQAQVIIEDLSRRGIGILSHQQWFPDQKISIFMVAAEITARVVRIRYVGPECFNIGSVILNIRNYDQKDGILYTPGIVTEASTSVFGTTTQSVRTDLQNTQFHSWFNGRIDNATTAVPEPSNMALSAISMAAFALWRRFRKPVG